MPSIQTTSAMTGAAAEVVRREWAALRRLASRIAGRPDAEDAVQDGCLRLLSAPRVEHPRAFLFRAVASAAIDLLRRRAVRAAFAERFEPMPAEGERAPDEAASRAADAARLRRALARLPERARQAFLLHRIHDLTHAEVAARLGVSPKTVERDIARAFRHCRAKLEG
jgi:RNA polymerase sigma-70 factor (ECF subfamily)